MDRKPPGLDSAFGRNVTKYMARLHVFLYRHTGGRIGGRHRIGPAMFKPVPRLLLDHVGRSSGTAYTTPLLYLEDGADLVVVASSGGMKHDPQWYRNLMAAPDTTVQVGPDVRRVLRACLRAAPRPSRLLPTAAAHVRAVSFAARGAAQGGR